MKKRLLKLMNRVFKFRKPSYPERPNGELTITFKKSQHIGAIKTVMVSPHIGSNPKNFYQNGRMKHYARIRIVKHLGMLNYQIKFI